MRVGLEQVVPGCLLLTDVMGKTNHPIMPKNTVLTEKHILFLEKFLVSEVDVSAKLVNGETFIPKKVIKKHVAQPSAQPEKASEHRSFASHYEEVVREYKKLFSAWQNNLPIDMPVIRKLCLPLIERIEERDFAVHTLHHYATKEDYFYHHSVAVAVLSAYLAKRIGYPKKEWLQIALAGLLSDAGMAKLEDAIYLKKGSLREAERTELKKHPTYSYRLIEQAPTITYAVKLAVLQHHERMDGSGYPLGLSGDKIHPYARIIAVCDIYHAMSCERMYREKQSLFQVIEELQEEQFTKLDPQVVQAFIKSIVHFSIGTKVLLSNGKVGEIVFMESKHPTRPIVRMEESGEIIALTSERSLFIQEIVTG